MENQAAIEQALKTFSEALNEKPKWVIALTYKGRFIGRHGQYEDENEKSAREMTRKIFGDKIQATEPHFIPLNDEKVAQITYEYVLATMKLSEQLKSSRDTYAIATGDGSYIIWFTFRYIVGVNYSNFGIVALDKTLDSIFHNLQELHDAIWEIDGYHEGE
jgi:hypothetical protein